MEYGLWIMGLSIMDYGVWITHNPYSIIHSPDSLIQIPQSREKRDVRGGREERGEKREERREKRGEIKPFGYFVTKIKRGPERLSLHCNGGPISMCVAMMVDLLSWCSPTQPPRQSSCLTFLECS